MGRVQEKKLLSSWTKKSKTSYFTVIYGRRRIGKTRLVEETFKNSTLLKFEGLEGQPTREQQRHFLHRLAEISGKQEYRLIRTSRWIDILILLSEYLSSQYGNEPVVLFFDEFQWMASERTRLVSDLKYVWDNYFLKKNRIHLILCGSVCSFLVKKVIRSKSLYGRIDLEINLNQLSLSEISNIFQPKRSLRDIVELYMAVGGVPQYLKKIEPAASVRANLETLFFSASGYLVNEYDRIFASHFGKNPHYRKILSKLSRRLFATKEQIQESCRLGSGGRISEYLENLELAGLIERYAPLDKSGSSRMIRLRITDPFLMFYFRFVEPSLAKIRQARTGPIFTRFVPDNKYDVWRGHAFESVCHRHTSLIAEKLGFGAVNFDCGSWYSRSPGKGRSQVDLLYLRADRVITLCEMKFRDSKIGAGIIREVEQKKRMLPNPKGMTIECVLISATPPTRDLFQERYFNRILQLDDLF